MLVYLEMTHNARHPEFIHELISPEGRQYYTTWSYYFLVGALLLATLGHTELLPAATANALCVGLSGCVFFAYLDSSLDISHSKRRKEFRTHVLPLVISFFVVAIVLPRVSKHQPPTIVSIAILSAFAAVYVSSPSLSGKRGMAKLRELYGPSVGNAIVSIPLLWFILLAGMQRYEIDLNVSLVEI